MAVLRLNERIAAVRVVQIVEARRAKRIGPACSHLPVLVEVVAIAQIVTVGSAEIRVLVAPQVRLDLAVAEAPRVAREYRVHVTRGRAVLIRVERLVEMLVAQLKLLIA